jgi:hypothetical protein
VKIQKGGECVRQYRAGERGNEVSRTLQESEEPYSLRRLIQHFRDRGVRDSAVRAALWHLIDKTDVELDDNWELHPMR